MSMQDKVMTPQERQEADILGSVIAEWTSTNFLHIVNSGNMKTKAYNELKKVAQQRYPGNIDIKNIAIAGSFSGWNIYGGFFILYRLYCSMCKR